MENNPLLDISRISGRRGSKKSEEMQITLSFEDRSRLETITKTRTLQAQTVTRARILLLKADGESIDAIAEKVGLNRNSVLLCLKKYNQGGIENAIYDAPGRGRNAEITDDEKTWIINIACQSPGEFGYSAETWTYAKLTEHINKTAESAGFTRLSTLTKTSIKNILDAAEIKPFRIQYYCEKRDSDFEAKMHEVLLVYKQIEMLFDENGELFIPAGEHDVHTYLYDEKPGIQAIAITGKDLNPTLTSESVNHRKYMFMSCKERLMKYLVESYACKREKSTCILRLNKTQTELSDRVGFNVRSVQRSIAALEKENLLTLERGKITVSQEQFVKMRKYLEE